jgi:hypothetical protein
MAKDESLIIDGRLLHIAYGLHLGQQLAKGTL